MNYNLRTSRVVPPRRGGPDRRLWLLGLALGLFTCAASLHAASKTNAVLLELEGQVLVSRAGSDAWDLGKTNQLLLPRDRVRTQERSRAVILNSDLNTWRIGANSLIQMPEDRDKRSGFQLLRGLLYYFHRDQPGTLPVRTPSAYAVILGTEFTVSVDPVDGSTRIDLIEGQVEMTNAFGSLVLHSGEAAIARTNQPPAPTPALHAVNVVQWVLHYPAVLDPAELRLSENDRARLTDSLQAYQRGDLRSALSLLAAAPPGGSADERLYHASLLLSVGDVPETESRLAPLLTPDAAAERTGLLARSLQCLIAAVKHRPATNDLRAASPMISPLGDPIGDEFPKNSATALLAESYFQQSQRRLAVARELARQATVVAPTFGFAWARLAELEFGFGETDLARQALERARALAPRHAQAAALQGFVLAAENRIPEARRSFEDAMDLDGGLGLAWLGRGLCRIRQGDVIGGREDLQVAVTLEPQRALYRSYLGKAYGQEGDAARAAHELKLARAMDERDPTAWLYSALLNRDQNRVNTAVRELEQAQALNGGRQVYRSELLTDQDAAVQGVNLAALYADAGMVDWSAYTAGRAVQSDPANFAAHLFLGDSFQRQRDFGRVNQRFETPAVSEYLLANLLSPIGAGTLAQSVSQGEYSKLFTSDGLGFFSETEYLSRGAWTEAAAVYGTVQNSSFALSGFYRTDPGQRANNDSEQHELSIQFKQQVTPADQIYLRVTQGEFEGGDLIARQDPATANRTLRVREVQDPLLLAGYHHEWAPGVHSLALVGWVEDRQELDNGQQTTLFMDKILGTDVVAAAYPTSLEQRYRATVQLFTSELQQIWQREGHALIAGGRFQGGTVDVNNQGANAVVPDLFLTFNPAPQHIESDLGRASGYGYYQWQAQPSLLLVGGLSYDWLKHPVNFRYAPVTDGEDTTSQWSPKAGAVWTPTGRSTARVGYSQSLGGTGFDQSFRLEPTQVAGFNQAFRSLIPESLAGANSGARFESLGAAFEQRIGRSTYLALSGEWLQSDVSRRFGVFDSGPPTANPGVNSTTHEQLDYDEHTLVFSANQLLGEEWALGLRYRLSHAELESRFTAIPVPEITGTVPSRSESDAVLNQVHLFAGYQHSSGFFGLADAEWNGQVNHGSASMADDDFWQFNLQAGWRGWRRRVELRVGVLNIFDQDYRLNPINLTRELPRERTFMAACRLQF